MVTRRRHFQLRGSDWQQEGPMRKRVVSLFCRMTLYSGLSEQMEYD